MKIYTRTGDSGLTSTIGGRVAKNNAQVEAYGTIDELNAFVGLACALAARLGFSQLSEQLTVIQHELFDCGSDLAYANPKQSNYKMNGQPVDVLEQWIDEYTALAPAITRFILPGGTEASAQLHVCRTVCRRAERVVVAFAEQYPINEAVLKYLNRLSDYFFAAARAANVWQQTEDVAYARSGEVFR